MSEQVVRRSFKYKLYPNRAQVTAMEELLETHRRLYNSALEQRKTAYETGGLSVSYFDQTKWLKEIRPQSAYLSGANVSSLRRTLRRLDHAFSGFFRRAKNSEKPGYPRFRGRGRFNSVEFVLNNGARVTSEGRVYFQGIGAIKVKLHRPVEGRVKTIRFSRQADGWFVVFSCEAAQVETTPSSNPSVGIDLGLKSFLVTSHGETVAPSRFYRKAQKKLRRTQRAVARKKRGSKRRRKAVQGLARLHRHVADQRRDFHHKTALDLIRRYGRIAHEDLNVQWLADSRLAKSCRDAGLSQFLSILSHKAAWAGVEVKAVDPRYTTQTCSSCGRLAEERLNLKARVFSCCHCGLILDRDINAALNIWKAAWIEPSGVNQGDYLMGSLRSLAEE